MAQHDQVQQQPQWRRLRIPERICDKQLDVADIELPIELPYNRYPGQDSARRMGIFDREIVAILGAIGFESPSPSLKRWPQCAREVCPLCVEYFFGSWRDSFVDVDGVRGSTKEARDRWQWYDQYRAGLMWSLILGDEDDLKRITAWAAPDLPDEGGVDELPADDQAVHILLGEYLHKGVPPRDNPLRDRITKSRRKLSMAALATLDALTLGAASEARAAFAQYMKRYYHTRFDIYRIDLAVSIDGTILWHVARRHGIDVTPEEPQSRDMLLTGVQLPAEDASK